MKSVEYCPYNSIREVQEFQRKTQRLPGLTPKGLNSLNPKSKNPNHTIDCSGEDHLLFHVMLINSHKSQSQFNLHRNKRSEEIMKDLSVSFTGQSPWCLLRAVVYKREGDFGLNVFGIYVLTAPGGSKEVSQLVVSVILIGANNLVVC